MEIEDATPLDDAKRRDARFTSPLAEAPAFFILLSICAALHFNVSTSAFAAFVISALLSAAALFFIEERAPRGFWPVFAVVFILSTVCQCAALFRVCKNTETPDSVECCGRVLSSRKWGYNEALLISTPYGRFAAYVPYMEAPEEGSGVYLRGATFDFKKASAPGGFDENNYWRTRGAIKKLVVLEIKRKSAPSGAALFRQRLDRLISTKLPPLSASYMSAFTTGKRADDLQSLHKRAGTSHLLAVSGLHVWIIAGILVFFIKGALLRLAVVSPLLWLYLLILGFPAGGVRAALMAEILLVSRVVGKPNSAFNCVSVAAVFLLLVNPWYYFDVGWRLSVLCALFIAAAAPFLPHGWPRAVGLPVLLWFVSSSVAVYSFKEVPIAGLALNIAVVPLFGVLFPLFATTSLYAMSGLPFAALAADCSETILYFFHIFLDAGASVVSGAIGGGTSLYVLSAALFTFFAALRLGARAKRALCVALAFPAFLFF